MLATVTCLVGIVHMRGAAFIVENVSLFFFLHLSFLLGFGTIAWCLVIVSSSTWLG